MTIHLIATSDMKAARGIELHRLIRTADTNALACRETVNLILLLQNCTDDERERLTSVAPECCSLISMLSRCSLSAARNHVLRVIQAQGTLLDDDVVGFPDDDCWFPARFLERLSSVFRQRADLQVFFCRSSLQPDGEAFSAGELTTATIPQIVRLSSSNNVFYRGSVLKTVGLFDPDLGLGTAIGGSEDTDYVIRSALAAGAAGFIDRKLIGHAEPSRVSAVKYFRGSLVVLTRYANRRPRLMLEFVRKICVGFVFATRGRISFQYFFGSIVLAIKRRGFVPERAGS